MLNRAKTMITFQNIKHNYSLQVIINVDYHNNNLS
jgi:hypothetical protein